jgi:hypothetical protein
MAKPALRGSAILSFANWRSIALRRVLVAAAAGLLLVSCSSPPSQEEQTEAAERAALAPLKAAFPDVIMGYDFHGKSVDVSVDLNAMMSMDEDTEDAMKARALRDWSSAWRAQHRKEHGVLTVRIMDFRGRVESSKSVRV